MPWRDCTVSPHKETQKKTPIQVSFHWQETTGDATKTDVSRTKQYTAQKIITSLLNRVLATSDATSSNCSPEKT